MKTILILAAGLFIAGNSITAQSSTEARFGLRAGANISTISKSDDPDFSTGSKAGLNAAAFLELPLSPAISFQPELQFSQKGFKANGTFLSNPYEYKQTTNFIEVPLLLKLNPSKHFGILVGPQYSFLASTSTKFSISNSSYESLVKNDNDNLRKNILGGVLGVEAAADNMIIGLRYALDFQSNNGDGTSNTPRYKNNVASLYIGFRL